MDLRRVTLYVLLAALTLGLLSACSTTQAGSPAARSVAQRTYPSPEDAVVDLIQACRTGTFAKLTPIFGDKITGFSADTRERTEGDMQRLAAAYDRAHTLVQEADGSVTLQLGADKWEFPAPLVKQADAWRFDTDAGLAELMARRIDDNQTDVVDFLRSCAEAQARYRAMNPEHAATPVYAARFVSTKGKRDGLWWPDEMGAPLSPLGPTVAAALEAGEITPASRTARTFHGYRFKLLDAQGQGAPSGAHSYRDAQGRLTNGFAVLAWPAEYNSTGIMSFLTSADARVYERDLGAETDTTAKATTAFDPSGGWSEVGAGK